MNKDIKKIYNNFVLNNFIDFDNKQESLLKKIESTWKNSNKKI